MWKVSEKWNRPCLNWNGTLKKPQIIRNEEESNAKWCTICLKMWASDEK